MRKFFAITLALSFLGMTVSGIVLYFTPQGRIAYWVNWNFVGFSKDTWGDIHTVSWFLFLICAIFHIYYNWKPLLNYIKSKKLIISKQSWVSLFIFLVFIFSGIYKIPPLGYLITLNNYIKDSYAKKPGFEPPFGHAEEVSLENLSKRMNIDLGQAIEELKRSGIKFETSKELIKNIAKNNKKSPAEIYEIIKKFEKKEPFEILSSEEVEEKFTGSGLGRKTLRDVCKENGIEINFAKEILASKGIEMEEDDTFKATADKYNTRPIEILKMIMVKDYKK